MQAADFTLLRNDTLSWVEALPIANPFKAAGMLYVKLASLPVTELAGEQWFDLLELMQPKIEFLYKNLKKSYLGKTSSSLIEQSKHSALAISLVTRYANGYAVIPQLTSTNAMDADGVSLHAKSLYRAIYYLNYVLLASYQLHLAVPTQTWLHLHKLYLQAEQQALDNITVNNTPNEPHTINEIYKICLLLAASNPYQLGITDIQKLYDALIQWVEHIKIQKDDIKNVTFIFYLNEDLPPTHLGINKNITSSPFMRGINTNTLCQHVTTIMKQREPNIRESSNMLATTLLQKIITAWSNFSERHPNRSVHQGSMHIAIGLASIYHHLGENKPRAENDMFSTVASSPTYPLYIWNIINSSATGYCFQTDLAKIAGIEIGELVGLRLKSESTSNEPWRIGTVRWVKKVDAEYYHIGILMLAQNSNILAVQAIRADSKQRYRSLLLLDRTNIDHENTLIMPAVDNVISHEHLTVISYDQKIDIQLTEPISITDRFSQFKYEILEEFPQ